MKNRPQNHLTAVPPFHHSRIPSFPAPRSAVVSGQPARHSFSEGGWSVVSGRCSVVSWSRSAFTLVEMLVVIAIIATLAALIFPSMAGIKNSRIKARARSELTQLETAIDAYKARLGYYPPGDDYTNPATGTRLNSLYFELLGVANTNNYCVTLDGSASIPANVFSPGPSPFGPNVGAILNCTRGSGGDEGGKAVPIVKTLTSDKFMTFSGAPYAVLGTALEGPQMITDPVSQRKINPWRYRNPGISNINSFDLWVVVNTGSKWTRICNWSKTPLVTTSPD